MTGTGIPRRDTSRTRSTAKSQGCKACGTACSCCPNWCHTCNVRKCRVGKQSKWLDDALTTQYTRDYPPKSVFPERRLPANGLLDSMPFYGDTTNRADYTPKQSRSQSARPAEKGIPSNRFDDATTYRAEFPPKRADLESPPTMAHPSWSAPFVGVTEYNAEYVPRKVRPWTAEPPLPPPSVPLEGTTEYRDSYMRKPMPLRDMRTSQPLLPSNHVPTITTYGHDYIPLPFEKRERLHCCDDPRHPADYPPPCEWHPTGAGTGRRTGSALRRPPHSGGASGATGQRASSAHRAVTFGPRPGSAQRTR